MHYISSLFLPYVCTIYYYLTFSCIVCSTTLSTPFKIHFGSPNFFDPSSNPKLFKLLNGLSITMQANSESFEAYLIAVTAPMLLPHNAMHWTPIFWRRNFIIVSTSFVSWTPRLMYSPSEFPQPAKSKVKTLRPINFVIFLKTNEFKNNHYLFYLIKNCITFIQFLFYNFKLKKKALIIYTFFLYFWPFSNKAGIKGKGSNLQPPLQCKYIIVGLWTKDIGGEIS